MSEYPEPSGNHLLVLTTVGNSDDAMRLGRELVTRRLAACVNRIGPVNSVYRWQDEVKEDQEFMLLIKTTRENFERLEQAIRELHRYELPEIIAIPIARGEATYLNWLTANASALPGDMP